ncbi:MAG: selenium cofactor biosynthesis protein YqeC [Candidatus Wenzhouxiangella sp. M2_3B_020]
MTGLLEALDVDNGIVAAIGAGGKKSLLYAIAAASDGRIAWTTTVHSPVPPRWTGIEVNVADPSELIRRARSGSDARVRAFVQPAAKTGRVAGLDVEQVETLHAAGGFDLTLVKADGARMRGIKAPKPGEPVLPPSTRRVLVAVSAGVLGKPLDDEVAHRPERIGRITGLEAGHRMEPAHFARLFSHEHGLLQGTSGFEVRVVINQVDDEKRRRDAEDASLEILAANPALDRVVLTCLQRGRDPAGAVVAVIDRECA